MTYQLKVEKIGNKTYVKCPICDEVLATNDAEYFLKKFHKNAVEPLSSCSHFEVIDVYKDPKSSQNIPKYEAKAVMKFEFRKCISFIIPRSS
ncbi:MAG: hypothetical protein L7G90_02800 [Candidatus Nanopusillus sp.]|nr:hypothetical protein [Candidatus Nanopusillus sp.]